MKAHPAAAVFPLLTGDEFDELVDDIRVNGQRVPVTTWNGQLLDGRNRVRACEKLGIKVDSEPWDGKGSPAAYVVSVNLRRRHLTPSQRAMVAAELKPAFAAEAKERQRATAPSRGKQGGRGKTKLPVKRDGKVSRSGEARTQAAKALDVAPAYVSTAERIQRSRPDLAEKVKAGEVTIRQAAREMDGPSPKEIAKNDDHARWYDAMHKLSVLLRGIREHGGAARIASGMRPDKRAFEVEQIEGLINELRAWVRALKEAA